MKKTIAGIKEGFLAPLKVIPLILKTPALLGLILIPLGVNIALYVLFFVYGSQYLDGLVQNTIAQLSASLPQWAKWFGIVSQVLLSFFSWLLLIAVMALTFTTVSAVLAAPFNEMLSSKTEQTILKLKAQSLDLSIAQSIKIEIKRSAVLIGGSLMALVMGLIPFMQIPALLLGALLLSFEYFGVALGRKERKVTASLQFILKHLPVSIGFGLFLFLLMAIPFASIFYIPLAVVAGTAIVTGKSENQRVS